jgi:hypothetical protein
MCFLPYRWDRAVGTLRVVTKLDRLGGSTREIARPLIDRNSKASGSVQGSVRNAVAGLLAEDYKREETTMRKIIIAGFALGLRALLL